MNFEVFISKFADIKLEYTKIGNKYFLADAEMKELSKKLNCNIAAIGLILGEDKKDKFTPSIALLEILSKVSNEKVFVNYIGEIDFLYGKDLKKGIFSSLQAAQKRDSSSLSRMSRTKTLAMARYQLN